MVYKKRLVDHHTWYKGRDAFVRKKITAFAVIFVVRPQGLVVSPKAYVIVSRARLLVKGERQPGVPGFASHSGVAT